MDYDFGPVEETTALVAVPPGTYLCQVEEVRTRITQDGSDLWGIKLVVAKGEHQGKVAAWDNLVWSPRGVGRVKRILRLLGFPVEGRLTIDSRDLEGRKIRATVGPESYRDPVTGSTTVRNRVPFDGYAEKGEEEEEVPF